MSRESIEEQLNDGRAAAMESGREKRVESLGIEKGEEEEDEGEVTVPAPSVLEIKIKIIKRKRKEKEEERKERKENKEKRDNEERICILFTAINNCILLFGHIIREGFENQFQFFSDGK